MMTIDFDSIQFALYYSLLIMIVSFYYYQKGKNEGIKHTTEVMFIFEPEALIRMQIKLKKAINNVSETDA